MSETGPVHVVDDDEAMQDSLVFLLRSAALDAVAHESAEAFLAALPGLSSGCVITDVRMPGLSGIELLRRLRSLDKHLPVIVMTGHSDVPLAVEALKSGAFDFVEKPFEDERMIDAVRSALAFRSRSLEREEGRAAVRARLATLSTRERQVFDGLVAGQANKVIAHELGISPRTVEIYRANVMAKLGASSLSEVVRMSFIAGEGEGDEESRW